jgi:hypothetical protein
MSFLVLVFFGAVAFFVLCAVLVIALVANRSAGNRGRSSNDWPRAPGAPADPFPGAFQQPFGSDPIGGGGHHGGGHHHHGGHDAGGGFGGGGHDFGGGGHHGGHHG